MRDVNSTGISRQVYVVRAVERSHLELQNDQHEWIQVDNAATCTLHLRKQRNGCSRAFMLQY